MSDLPTLQPGDSINPVPPVDANTTPVFDLDNLSWGDVKTLSLLDQRVRAATTEAELTQAFQDTQAFLARITLSIPRDWLIKSAPKTIDWTKPESFDWLRANKFSALGEALRTTLNTDTASKN